MKTNDEVHRDARVCAVKCYYKADGVISDAMDAFQEQWNAQHPEHTISDTRSFIQLSVSKLEVSHTLHDAVGHGRPKLLSDDDAVKCADIVAEGYMQQQVVTEEGVSHEYEELKQFTSLSDALQMSARLRALTTDKGLKPEYVERRLHDVAPWLKYGVLPMKLPLSVDVMEARLQYCGMMLKFIEEDPDFLKRVFWYDECRIWFNMDLAGKLKVWYDRRKLAGQPPEENPMFELHGARRIDFALILNARLGCVYVEFLTGTTDIDTMGRHNPGMREHMERRKDFELARIEAVGDIEKKKGTGCYRTKDSKYVKPASSATAAEVADILMEGYFEKGVKRAKEQGWEPKLSMDNPNFHHVHPHLCNLVDDETGYEHLLELPKYSPDLHQIVEHPFANVKQGTVVDIYKQGWHVAVEGDVKLLRDMVLSRCLAITPQQVESGLKQLKECYQVVAAPTTEDVTINGHSYQGVEGGRPPKRFR